ncbi:MAG TPA: cysteine--tRNA ligase [Acidimicrobiales bacterium]|nr:cysteine--tRNA ligase [Acidimicrobiales bacterium]
MRIHDSADGQVRELEQREPGKVSMYVCGPTVYDVPHLGHGRMAMVYDILRRYLEWSGLEVRHVSNVTDVDDKIIERALDHGEDPGAFAERFEAVWWDTMDRLGILRPTVAPKATAFIKRMVELVGELESKGFAYPTSDGVYFNSESLEGYGLLARQPLDELRTGERVEMVEGKRSPLDFALWKLAKEGEPAWDSPWGDGRPGWHTECVVMSLDLLEDGFDLHAGGMDLMFPHHENERAQAVALGHTFARHWMHHAFVVDPGGEKMSKSLGNFTTLVDLIDRHDPRAFRLLLLQAHYRAPVEITPDTISQAEAAISRFDNLARRVPGYVDAPLDRAAIAAFRGYMDDDLRSQAATALIFDLVTEANSAVDADDAERARTAAATAFHLLAAVGLETKGASDIDDETRRLMRERDDARTAKDWTRSDTLRDELMAKGWIVQDTPQGTTVHH